MRVLVTGGAGFVGRGLVRDLVDAGHAVRVLDTLAEQVHGPGADWPPELAGAELRRGDVRDPAAVAEAVAGVEAVAHLAAETGVGQSMVEIARYVDVNERGTAVLLDALARQGGPVRLVLASSRAVYGEGLYACPRCGEVAPPPRTAAALAAGDWDPPCPACGGAIAPLPTHEDAPARPGSVYAATKLAQEQLCRVVAAAYGLPLTVLRYFNVYGPGQSLANPYTGILATFHARAAAGKPVEVYEDGREQRDFVFVDDVVAATRRALLRPAGVVREETLNVGSGRATTVGELAEAVVRLGGWDVPVRVTGAYRLGDVRHAVADPRRCAATLDPAPATPLETGLARWLAWAGTAGGGDRTDRAAAELAARGMLGRARSG